MEVESPVVTANVTFTGTVLSRFMLTFVLIDLDNEEVQDENLAPKVEYKNYGDEKSGFIIWKLGDTYFDFAF